jgi:hypothetical protein
MTSPDGIGRTVSVPITKRPSHVCHLRTELRIKGMVPETTWSNLKVSSYGSKPVSRPSSASLSGSMWEGGPD